MAKNNFIPLVGGGTQMPASAEAVAADILRLDGAVSDLAEDVGTIENWDAGDIPYDSSENYNDGTVGGSLNDLKSAFSDAKNGLSKTKRQTAKWSLGYIDSSTGQKRNATDAAVTQLLSLKVGDYITIKQSGWTILVHKYVNGAYDGYQNCATVFGNTNVGNHYVTSDMDVILGFWYSPSAAISDLLDISNYVEVWQNYNYKRIDDLEKETAVLTIEVQEKEDKSYNYSTVSLTLQNGNYNGDSAIFASNNSRRCADITVSEGEVYKITCNCVTSGDRLYYLTDGMNVIKQVKATSEMLELDDYEIRIPTGVTHLLLNAGIREFWEWSPYFKINAKRRTSQTYLTAGEINDTKNTVNGAYIFNDVQDVELIKGIDTNPIGATFSPIVSGNNFYVVLNVSEGETYKITGYISGAVQWMIKLLDSNNIILGRQTQGESTKSEKTAIVTIPKYVSKLAVSFAINSYEDTWSIKKETFATISELNSRASYLEEKTSEFEDDLQAFAGKTLLWFGTSIMTTSDGNVMLKDETGHSYSIPTYTAHLIGANCINKAVGESQARLGWEWRKTANDTYGWTGAPWQVVFKGLSANLTEKNDLITNYDSKWRDLIGGAISYDPSGKPETMTEEWAAKIRGWSYENMLVPYLDGTYDMPDIFVFEHGHNDFDNFSENSPADGDMNGDLTDQNSFDRTTYAGAMAFLFRTIWEHNPDAKIVIVSHYDNEDTRFKTIFNSQKEVAEGQRILFCNVADSVGWSHRTMQTTGYWNTITHLWIPSGGNLQTITHKAQQIMDGTHPSSDWSGNAIKRESEVIADFFMKNRKFLCDK